MCPVIDGQAVSAAVTNPAFLDAQVDDVALGKIGLHNSDVSDSGPFLDNTQRCINRLFTATGVSETITDGTTYNATSGTISNGDPYETALRILANKFDSMTGHTHDTSIPGDGGPVTIGSGVSSITPSGYSPMFGDITFTPSGNITISPSGQQIIFSVETNTFDPQSANTVYAGPVSGGDDLPSFRHLVVSDQTIITQAISSTDIDWSAGNLFTKTLASNTTFTFSNQLSGQTIVVRLTNTASNYTVTWPTVRWAGGTPPTMSPGAVSDVYTFVYDGSNTYGSFVQNMS